MRYTTKYAGLIWVWDDNEFAETAWLYPHQVVWDPERWWEAIEECWGMNQTDAPADAWPTSRPARGFNVPPPAMVEFLQDAAAEEALGGYGDWLKEQRETGLSDEADARAEFERSDNG